MNYVYFLKSQKVNWYYVGSTSNLAKRVEQHNNGEVRSTKSRAPYDLVYEEQYVKLSDARAREKEIKSIRQIKEEIIINLNKALSSNG